MMDGENFLGIEMVDRFLLLIFFFFWKDFIVNWKKLSEFYKECGDLIDLVDIFYGYLFWRILSVNCMY